MKVLVIRMSSFGDILHTAVAVQLLRRWQPDAHITWLVHAPFDRLVRRIRGIDRVMVVPRAWLRPRIAIHRQLRFSKFDLALDFQGLLKSGFWTWASRAPRRIGFGRRHLREPLARVFYNHSVDAAVDGWIEQLRDIVRSADAPPLLTRSAPGHVIVKYTTLVLEAGLTPEFAVRHWTPRVELDADPDARARVAEWRATTLGASTPYLIFYLGSSWPTKRWPADRWVELIRYLTEETGWPAVLGWGPGELDLARDVAHQLGNGAYLIPAWRWDELIELVEHASLVVGYDTGVTHLACARERPVVFLMGATSPHRNGPWRFDRQKAVYHPPPCGPCYRRTCPFQVECMDRIRVAEVTDLSRQLLDTTPT